MLEFLQRKNVKKAFCQTFVNNEHWMTRNWYEKFPKSTLSNVKNSRSEKQRLKRKKSWIVPSSYFDSGPLSAFSHLSYSKVFKKQKKFLTSTCWSTLETTNNNLYYTYSGSFYLLVDPLHLLSPLNGGSFLEVLLQLIANKAKQIT